MKPLRVGELIVAHADDLLPITKDTANVTCVMRRTGVDPETRAISYEMLFPGDAGYEEALASAREAEEALAREYGVRAADLAPEHGVLKVFRPVAPALPATREPGEEG